MHEEESCGWPHNVSAGPATPGRLSVPTAGAATTTASSRCSRRRSARSSARSSVGSSTAGQRSRFQAVALLARVERARIRADESLTEAQRDVQLKRLDGVATILAQIAAREPSLFVLLDEDAEVTDATRRSSARCSARPASSPSPEPDVRAGPRRPTRVPSAQVVPQSVVAAQLANPFLVPTSPRPRRPGAGPPGRLGADRAAAQLLRAPLARALGLHGRSRSPG